MSVLSTLLIIYYLRSAIIVFLLLNQMGKFYELFEMDAHVGAKELGLQYMKVLDLAIAGSVFMLVCCYH